jgi:hypothetical protein
MCALQLKIATINGLGEQVVKIIVHSLVSLMLTY